MLFLMLFLVRVVMQSAPNYLWEGNVAYVYAGIFEYYLYKS